MKILTSITAFTTSEGERIAYTYSEVSEDGTVISQNNKGNLILMDATQKKHLDALKKYISERIAE